MAYCPDCGAEVSKGVKFCSECGTPLEDSAAANSPPAGSGSGTSGTNERGAGGTTAADGATASTTSAGGTATADATATTTSSTAGTADDPANQESSLDLPANQAAALSYVLGLLTGLVVFIIEDENEFVQFHAAQSIVLSVAFGGLYLVFGVLTSILSFLPDVIGVLLISLLGLVQAVIGLAGFVAWVYLIIQAYQGERFVAPVIGGFAENLAKQG
ncbi:zinc-ribbon domain-containing protein [Haloglomus salinum]|jgi:uncharacterized membrane protein|uniref:zinc-ribbon domain-containing protein n=1 Tax=Haloglomus salinum TaxID=2962673 RepID=UPI0020C999DA|nr:zinc-ribbon domain-containing protein [Haloglomus salinum]